MRPIIAYVSVCATAEQNLVDGLLQLLFGHRADVYLYDWDVKEVSMVKEEHPTPDPVLIVLSRDRRSHDGQQIWQIVRRQYPAVPVIWLRSDGGSPELFEPDEDRITRGIDTSTDVHKEDALRKFVRTITELTGIEPTLKL